MAETMTLKNKMPVARKVGGFGSVQPAGAANRGDEITVPAKVGNQLRRAEGWEPVEPEKPAVKPGNKAQAGKDES